MFSLNRWIGTVRKSWPFEKKTVFSQEVDAWMPPFFWKDNTSRGFKKNINFFPGGPLSFTYYPLNKCKYRNYSLFYEMGGFWGKGQTPGERWPKCLQWTQKFSKHSTGSLALLAEEKIALQNSKVWKVSYIQLTFHWGMPSNENEVKYGCFLKLLSFEK